MELISYFEMSGPKCHEHRKRAIFIGTPCELKASLLCLSIVWLKLLLLLWHKRKIWMNVKPPRTKKSQNEAKKLVWTGFVARLNISICQKKIIGHEKIISHVFLSRVFHVYNGKILAWHTNLVTNILLHLT